MAANFARSLQQFEVIIPQHVTDTGSFISHRVEHLIESGITQTTRHKRHTNNAQNSKSRPGSLGYNNETSQNFANTERLNNNNDDLKKLYFMLTVNNRSLHLELEPNDNLVAPGLTIERRPCGYRNLSHAQIKAYPRNKCHFVGTVKGDPDSRVALATCNGLVSINFFWSDLI